MQELATLLVPEWDSRSAGELAQALVQVTEMVLGHRSGSVLVLS